MMSMIGRFIGTKDIRHPMLLSAVVFFGIAIHSSNAVTSYKIELFGSNATQSSDISADEFLAEKAVDGKTFLQMGDPTCTHTKNEASAWWMIHLSTVYVVETVKLFNRAGSYRRLQKLNILVGFLPDVNQQTLCKYYDKTVPKGSSDTVYCTRPVLGTYVSVQRTSSHTDEEDGSVTQYDGFLTICEVEVYGYEGKLTLNKANAEQSTTLYTAEKAVDGQTKGSHNWTDVCASTDEGENSWWRIKLDQVYAVQAVKIHNGKKMYRRLRELNVFVSRTTNLTEQSLCTYYNDSVPSLGSALIMCNDTKEGTYVTIQKTTRADYNDNGTLTGNYGGYLTLCEVEIYGYEVVSCGPPPNIAGTTWSGTDFTYWAPVVYSCNSGYEVSSGVSESRCTAASNWTTANIACQRLNCGQPPAIPNAKWTGYNFTYQSIVEYKCNERYRASLRNTKKQCGANKTWIGTNIKCQAIIIDKSKCKGPAPPSIQSVYFNYDNSGKTANVTITWQMSAPYDHHCNSYTKVEVLYTTGANKEKTVTFPSFGKSPPKKFTVVIPRNPQHSLIKLRVFNDAGMSSSSQPFIVSERLTETGTLGIGLLTGFAVGGFGLLFMIGAVIYVAAQKRHHRKKSQPVVSSKRLSGKSPGSKEVKSLQNGDAESPHSVDTADRVELPETKDVQVYGNVLTGPKTSQVHVRGGNLYTSTEQGENSTTHADQHMDQLEGYDENSRGHADDLLDIMDTSEIKDENLYANTPTTQDENSTTQASDDMEPLGALETLEVLDEHLYANTPTRKEEISTTQTYQPSDHIEGHDGNSIPQAFKPVDPATETSDYQNVSMKSTSTPMFKSVI